MAIIGWLFLLGASLVLSFVSLSVIFIGSGFSGKVEGEAVFLLVCAVFLWYITVTHAPFAISLL